jgi:hypothetical protein
MKLSQIILAATVGTALLGSGAAFGLEPIGEPPKGKDGEPSTTSKPPTAVYAQAAVKPIRVCGPVVTDTGQVVDNHHCFESSRKGMLRPHLAPPAPYRKTCGKGKDDKGLVVVDRQGHAIERCEFYPATGPLITIG